MTLEYSDMDSQVMQRVFGSSNQSTAGYTATASAGYVEYNDDRSYTQQSAGAGTTYTSNTQTTSRNSAGSI